MREFLLWARVNKKSFEDDEYRSKLLSQHFGTKTLDQITPEMVERFKGEMVRTRSKATVNRYLALLRHLFNRAIKRGLKLSNPVSAIGLFREENTRIRWLTEEEEERLGAVIPEPYWSFCRVALYTGCRRSELWAARWDHIDWQRGVLVLPTSKNGNPKIIELSTLVREILQRVPRQIDSQLVFPNCANISHRFPAWVKLAQLPGKMSFHTLRHTWASRLVMEGVDLLTVKELGGWKDLAMVQRYAHLAPEHRRAAVEKLVKRKARESSGTESGTERLASIV
jgi:integrase